MGTVAGRVAHRYYSLKLFGVETSDYKYDLVNVVFQVKRDLKFKSFVKQVVCSPDKITLPDFKEGFGMCVTSECAPSVCVCVLAVGRVIVIGCLV